MNEPKEIKYNISIDEESVKAASAQMVEMLKKLQELKTLADELNSCIAKIELKINVQS